MDYINMWMEWGDVLCLGSQRIFMYFELFSVFTNVNYMFAQICLIHILSLASEFYIPKWMDLKQRGAI